MKKNQKNEEKIINAEDRVLGRVASETAKYLMGKNKADFERHIYTGTKVKVTNASKLKMTSEKLEELYHARYSGHRDGLRIITGAKTVEKKGFKELIKLAVYGMLPNNKLKRIMMNNLTIED